MKEIGDSLWIKNNDLLLTLAGLSNLQVVKGEVMLHNNRNLLTTRDVVNLRAVGQSVDVYGNQHLLDLHAFKWIQDALVRVEPIIACNCAGASVGVEATSISEH